MKIIKAILFCALGIVLCFGAVKGSKSLIEQQNASYVPENPVLAEKDNTNHEYPTDIDKMISHIVEGTEETVLPVDYEQDYTIYEGKFYVTGNQGQTWLPVPDDTDLGYARISEYQNLVSSSNIHISGEKISIVYGGRGPENISIIRTDSHGEVWSVGSISKTATHDLKNGYDKMYIDFLEDGKTGYLAAIRNEGTVQEEIFAFWSVNSGVVWGPVDVHDPLYNEIMAQFELQGIEHE